MIRIGVNGACGRMGMRLVDLVSQAEDMQLTVALEREGHPSLGQDAGLVAGRGELGVPVTSALGAADLDVLLDFSAPESTVVRARECAAAKAAMVIGTTGLSGEQSEIVKAAAREVPILLAPNMSVGVYVTADAAGRVAKALGDDYDVEIVEMHHRFKKDAPSGTALQIARKIAEATGRNLEECGIYGRHGIVGERPPGQIGIHAVRGGDVVGEHRIIFSTLGESVEIAHRAHTRDTFARGALRAARFLVGRAPGLYGIGDML